MTIYLGFPPFPSSVHTLMMYSVLSVVYLVKATTYSAGISVKSLVPLQTELGLSIVTVSVVAVGVGVDVDPGAGVLVGAGV